MRTKLNHLFLAASLVLIANTGVQAASTLPTQSIAQAGVAIEATPRKVAAGTWEFALAFNTHMGGLTDDPAKQAVLVADGKATYKAVAWQGDPPGGHHRKGVLRFKTVSPEPKAIELKIQRPNESAPRVFRWQLN